LTNAGKFEHRLLTAGRFQTMFLVTFLSHLLQQLVGWLVAWRYDWTARRAEAGGLRAARLALAEYLPPAGVVLEVGAGTGATLASGAYDARPPDAPRRITLTEPDLYMRDRLQRKVEAGLGRTVTAPIVVQDAALPSLPFREHEFDAVVMCFVASHLHGRADGMKELFRVMRPGGVLAVLDHGAHAVDEHARVVSRAENDAPVGSRTKHHHCHENHHHGNLDWHSNHANGNFSLSWFWEWVRFHIVVRRHMHSHGHAGLSFEPIIDDATAAGFERDVVRTIDVHGTGIKFLSEVLVAVFRKPLDGTASVAR
jgi:ubiquinone/menaquinone biosynthesis C-methylase UbiE